MEAGEFLNNGPQADHQMQKVESNGEQQEQDQDVEQPYSGSGDYSNEQEDQDDQ